MTTLQATAKAVFTTTISLQLICSATTFEDLRYHRSAALRPK